MTNVELTPLTREPKFGFRDLLSAFWAKLASTFAQPDHLRTETPSGNAVVLKQIPKGRQFKLEFADGTIGIVDVESDLTPDQWLEAQPRHIRISGAAYRKPEEIVRITEFKQ